MATLIGRVGMVIKGAWDSSVAYDTLDVVTYNNNTYIAKQASPAGTLPTNTTYWQLSLDASLLANKVSGATSGNFAGLDSNGNITDSGHKHSDYVTDVSGKADKVSGATNGNLANLNANGNLEDSGVSAGDILELVELPYNTFTWSDSLKAFQKTNVTLDASKFRGLLITPTNGYATVGGRYVASEHAIYVTGWLPRTGDPMGSDYEFTCYAVMTKSAT